MAEDDKLEDAHEIVKMAHRCWREGRDATSEWRTQAPQWFDLVANKQWDKDDIDVLTEENRIPVVINRVARTINAIIGTQVANRQETIFHPRTEGDVQKNEVLTGAAEWVRDGCEAEDEESDAFEDTTICGMGWTETRLDFESDPEGTTRIERIDPLEMYWDPNAKKRNLADAKWIIRVKPVPRDEFEDTWPGKLASMLSDPWDGGSDQTTEPRHHVYPQDAYNEQQHSSQRTRGMRPIKVAQIQWSERVPMYRVGKAAERISGEAFKSLKKKLDDRKIPYIKQMGVRWKQAFVAGGQWLDEPEKGDEPENCPYPDGPTFRCITYKRDRNKNTWYGVVAAMMDPQKYGNKFLSLVMDIVRSNAKGGVMMESDATDKPSEVEAKWARPDALVFLRPGALSGKKVQERPKAQLPAGLDRLVAYFLDSVHEVTGINLELLGMANREQAGVLENTRKQAGVTIIAPLFDGLRRYRKEQGRVLLYFIQTYLSDGRLIRITGENGKQQYAKLVKDPNVAKYDVVVDEAPTSPNVKERTFAVLGELTPQLLKAGVPVPPAILKYAPLPSSLIEEWIGFIEQMAGADPRAMAEQNQKLQQENQDLRLKKEEKMVELQMDREKQAQEMAMEREKMQLEREKMMVEIEIERAKLQMEQEKLGMELQMDQQRMAAEQQMAEHKMHGEMQLAQHETTTKLGLEKQKADAQAHAALHGKEDAIESAFSKSFAKHSKKRKFKVVRDGAGELVGVNEE